jgi:GTP-binding protein Era
VSEAAKPDDSLSGNHRAGFVAIVGRPNVGKSTLLNKLIGQKISITSRKAQTTRHRISGIRTDPDTQFIFVDTPGFQRKYVSALNRALNRTVTETLTDVDVIVFVIETLRFGPADQELLRLLPLRKPVILAINKIDNQQDKTRLLPFIKDVAARFAFAEIIPLSAKQGTQIDALLVAVRRQLSEGPLLFDKDQITDRNTRFLAAEFIREKIFRLSGEELPYATSVVIEQWEEVGNLTRIHAAIVVDKPNHKAIIIGKQGEKLKRIGTDARLDLEKLLETKVFLSLFVKVKSGWADDQVMLKQLGYE